ncbi:SusD/RagB family nutrient-binding outer membrane lipoprotein [Bacteroides mediterraneensis]|uniref:SusD/RagB family nutrient-binding outer membrane lipoprotein n=1 Tax=Bacteroides mediterraneensis TaxID=1841856 RepID=A0ABS2EYX5_9BACE|nr:SusD/RagB family nutrient-binding outer membrane lipoprotein [Bacteroides mediterraneensis]MBM6759871.1 SusD/RagB family nutrient-binding outer membrane lipoprotein [Bacteroides mediterraneensis]
MKRYIKKIIMAFMAGALIWSATGCTNSFEEINQDPDNATNVPNGNLLAYVIYYTSYRFNDRWFAMDEPMTFCGYAAKMSYIDESRYSYRTGIQDNNWEYVYRILNNVMDLQGRATAGSNLMNVAKVLEVTVMQIATDRWRDVPYSDAVKMGEGILTPKYDKQEDIYPALLAKLKEAADSFASNEGTDDISDGDLLFGGDITKWQKYCNSLRLRLAIRISEVSPELAQSTVEEVLGDPSRYPIMDSNDDNAFFWWQGSDSNFFEPIADQYRTRKTEYCASDVMVDNLLAADDPRIGIYFTPTPASQTEGDDDYTDGTPVYRGYTIGASSNAVSKLYSVWNYKYGQDLGGFSPWMRVAEVYFHIAEAAMLNYNTGNYGTAAVNYEKAVRFSMVENEVSDADATEYLENGGKFDNTLKKIWYEEWVAMFKQAMEGWSLYRRTGVPENNYIAPGRTAQYANHNVPPLRSPYPSTELNLNAANNAPYNAEVVDNLWGKPMWWDTREGVY